MSAILGILHRDGAPVAPETLQPALDALAPYGREGGQVWHDGAAALAHITNPLTPGEALTAQPVTRGSYTITADARIDNRPELFDELSVPDVARQGMSDATLIALAYAKWRANCPEYLIGDYAFALWDADAKTFYCARDFIGARPLYYTLTEGLFAFATELPALLALPGVPRELDEAEIARMLLSSEIAYSDPRGTFWKHAYRLTFGHHLTVSARSFEMRRYFDFNPRPRLRLGSLDEYADALYERVERAVADRLRLADSVRVGAHFSGGVDSTSVAVIAARLRRAGGLSAPFLYSWSPAPDETTDITATEHRRIEAAARREGLSVSYSPAVMQPVDDIDLALYPAHTLMPERPVQRRAADDGVRVIFSGWGGDEGISFNGRGLQGEWLFGGRWRTLARWLHLQEALSDPRRLKGAARRLWEHALAPTLPDVLYALLDPPNLAESFIHPDFLARVRSRIRPPDRGLRVVTRVHATQRRLFRNGHITQRMESWAWSGARHGITYVYPLADRRVVEFALSLPPDLHFDLARNAGRTLYRRTMARVLGETFVWDQIKQDTALFAAADAARAGRDSAALPPQMEALLALDCPWVDTARLRAALAARYTDLRPSQVGYRRGGLEALAIWSRSAGALTRD